MAKSEQAEIRVQWGDTDACLHLICECGAETHKDTPYITAIACSVCGQAYLLAEYMKPTKTSLEPCEPC